MFGKIAVAKSLDDLLELEVDSLKARNEQIKSLRKSENFMALAFVGYHERECNVACGLNADGSSLNEAVSDSIVYPRNTSPELEAFINRAERSFAKANNMFRR